MKPFVKFIDIANKMQSKSWSFAKQNKSINSKKLKKTNILSKLKTQIFKNKFLIYFWWSNNCKQIQTLTNTHLKI